MSKYMFFLSSLIVLLLLALMDFLTGVDFRITEFYLLPVILACWKTDVKFSYFMAVFAAFSAAMVKIVEANLALSILFCWDLSLDVIVFAFVAFLMLKLKAIRENEKRLAKTDYLTGAINPAGFSEILEAEINRSKRFNMPLSIAYIDCDDFSAVNNSLGHKEGNKVLSFVAETIQKNIRKTDFLSRLVDDEFALLLVGTTPENALNVINKLNDLLLYKMKKQNYPITFSIGLASFKVPPESGDIMLKTADMLMYSVKSTTKNAVKHKVFEDKPTLTGAEFEN